MLFRQLLLHFFPIQAPEGTQNYLFFAFADNIRVFRTVKARVVPRIKEIIEKPSFQVQVFFNHKAKLSSEAYESMPLFFLCLFIPVSKYFFFTKLSALISDNDDNNNIIDLIEKNITCTISSSNPEYGCFFFWKYIKDKQTICKL